MKLGAWLKRIFFSGPMPAEQFCSNCQFFSEKELERRLSNEHPLHQHHIMETGLWNPRGKDTSPLGWCGKQNYATALNGIPCDAWKWKRHA